MRREALGGVARKGDFLNWIRHLRFRMPHGPSSVRVER
jgi:hypothetical protein